MDEGVIKFICSLENAEPPPAIYTEKLNSWRSKLHKAGLIGESADGVGFGNVSRRFHGITFIISGSATGGTRTLKWQQYVLVEDFDLLANHVSGRGLVQPSSESLTHGMIYQTLPDVRWVLHAHNHSIWKSYKYIFPTTPEHVSYGTPEMAGEVKKLCLSLSALKTQIIIMGGHQDGILAYGKNLDLVGQRLLDLNTE